MALAQLSRFRVGPVTAMAAYGFFDETGALAFSSTRALATGTLAGHHAGVPKAGGLLSDAVRILRNVKAAAMARRWGRRKSAGKDALQEACSLDVLHAHKDALCAHLMERYRSWFGVRFECLLYDVTSTYFEGQAMKNTMQLRQAEAAFRIGKISGCVPPFIRKLTGSKPTYWSAFWDWRSGAPWRCGCVAKSLAPALVSFSRKSPLSGAWTSSCRSKTVGSPNANGRQTRPFRGRAAPPAGIDPATRAKNRRKRSGENRPLNE
jgi:hypothetical protein